MIVVKAHTLLQILKLHDLFHAHGTEVFDKTIHKLIVGDGEVSVTAETGPRIHYEGQQHHPSRIEDFLTTEMGGVAFIRLRYHVFITRQTPFGSAVIFVYHPGTTGSRP